MKIAITINGSDLTGTVDNRFGRTSKFMVYDLENDQYEIISNEDNLNASQGAGVQAAQLIANQQVEALITGHCGPKAFSVLKMAGVKVYNTQAETIKEAIEFYRAGKLQEAGDADVNSHWA